MQIIVKDHYWKTHGLPLAERLEIREVRRLVGRDLNVPVYVVRQEEVYRSTPLRLHIAKFEDRPSVWVALAGLFAIFNVEDVDDDVLRLVIGQCCRSNDINTELSTGIDNLSI